MEIQEISRFLHYHADGLHKLAEKLDRDGDALTSNEKKDIRTALAFTWLDEMNEEARFFFIRGNYKDYDNNRKQVFTTMEQLL